MLFDERFHFLIAHPGWIDFSIRCILDQLIGAETRFARFAIHERIRKTAYMTAGDPNTWIHQDRTLDTNIVLAFLDESLPPRVFYIILQFDA